MISRLKKNGKKGFTLVELIVVIAIIAILAAVAVPTTIHFVEKANKSKEATNIDVSNILEAIFTESVTDQGAFTMSTTDTQDTLKDKLTTQIGNNTGISYIKIIATVTDTQAKIEYEIVSSKYSDVKINKTMGGTCPVAGLGITATTTVFYKPGAAWTASAS